MCGVGLRYTADRENVARIRGVRDPTVKSVVSREAWQRPARYDNYIYIIIYLQNPDTYNRCSAKNKVRASMDTNTIIIESVDSIVESVDSIAGMNRVLVLSSHEFGGKLSIVYRLFAITKSRTAYIHPYQSYDDYYYT